MSAHDKTEKVLRDLHILLSKSEPYAKEPSKVIVDKQQMLDLLSDLNKSIYDIMDEYEMTQRSRDRAEREFRKKGDQIVWDASRKAEDIYAASVMYTDEALNRIQEIMRESDAKVKAIYKTVDEQLKEQEDVIKKNQSELKASLQDLLDTEKYLRLIEERNKEIEKEKFRKDPTLKPDANLYANRQTEVKVNRAVLQKLGLEEEAPLDENTEAEKPKDDAEAFFENEDLDALQDELNRESDNPGKAHKQEGGFLNAIKNLGANRK